MARAKDSPRNPQFCLERRNNPSDPRLCKPRPRPHGCPAGTEIPLRKTRKKWEARHVLARRKRNRRPFHRKRDAVRSAGSAGSSYFPGGAVGLSHTGAHRNPGSPVRYARLQSEGCHLPSGHSLEYGIHGGSADAGGSGRRIRHTSGKPGEDGRHLRHVYPGKPEGNLGCLE